MISPNVHSKNDRFDHDTIEPSPFIHSRTLRSSEFGIHWCWRMRMSKNASGVLDMKDTLRQKMPTKSCNLVQTSSNTPIFLSAMISNSMSWLDITCNNICMCIYIQFQSCNSHDPMKIPRQKLLVDQGHGCIPAAGPAQKALPAAGTDGGNAAPKRSPKKRPRRGKGQGKGEGEQVPVVVKHNKKVSNKITTLSTKLTEVRCIMTQISHATMLLSCIYFMRSHFQKKIGGCKPWQIGFKGIIRHLCKIDSCNLDLGFVATNWEASCGNGSSRPRSSWPMPL